jgi:hypothetical protein
MAKTALGQVSMAKTGSSEEVERLLQAGEAAVALEGGVAPGSSRWPRQAEQEMVAVHSTPGVVSQLRALGKQM